MLCSMHMQIELDEKPFKNDVLILIFRMMD